MNTVTLQELQQDPLTLLHRVEAGEMLVITSGNHPVAELRPVAPARSAPRPVGLAQGAFVVPPDFDDPLPESVLQEFEGQ